MSRMVDIKPEYIVTLDQKWMNLELMGLVYSKLEKITQEEKEETKDNKKCIKNAPNKWGLGMIYKFCT